ncbi:MAG: YCF48-related protein [Pirellulales bacterium]
MESRIGRRATWFFASLIAAGIGTVDSAAQAQTAVADRAPAAPQTLEITFRDDAALNAVYFINPAAGWAVGDRGVIWHTRDGGGTWQQQPSHVQCPLFGVFFVDAARGWAVGGTNKPFAAATSGVVLKTVDGGVTWSSAAAGPLPILKGVRFFNADQGVAFGAAGPMSPAGVLVTGDGGRSWQPIVGDGGGHWLTGDFVDAGAGAVAGSNGRFATMARGQVKSSPLAAGSLRSLHAMRLAAPTGGWLVGDGGFMATTSDLGRSWQTPKSALPNRAAAHFDFRAVAVHGASVWIAGSPGSRVFHSPDGGQTWQASPTVQTAPLRGLAFVDAEHGWAVGELGSILSTADGGKTWRRDRAGGQRAALLAVFARPADVPLELIAREGAADGYLTAVDVLYRSASSNEGERTREAMLLAGATAAETAWQFPLPPDDLALDPAGVLDALNRANDGQAAERLLNSLVRQVRIWRPEIIVTQTRGAQTSDSMAAVVEELVLRAVEAAADPQQFTELAAVTGLDAWQVKRVFGVLPPGGRGQQTIATGQFAPQLGVSLADWSAAGRRLLSSTPQSPPDTYELVLLTNRADNSDPSGRDLFRGLALAPGGDARRRVAALPAGDIDQLQRMATRRRNLGELLQRKAGDAAWAAQVVKLTDGMPDVGGGELVFQLADGYRVSGRLDLAADAYYLLARRYPEHPLTEQALRWLVQYYASSEASLRIGRRSSATGYASAVPANNVRLAAGGAGEDTGVASGTPVHASATGSASGTLVQASAEAPLQSETPPAVGLSRDERLRRTIELCKYLEGARPALFAEPGVRFPLVAAERQLGFGNPAKRYFLSLRSLPENDPWRRCAETEQWLAEPGDAPPPKPLGNCRRASDRPLLDGKLNEAIWQAADVLRLGHVTTGGLVAAATEPPAATEVRLAYDKQFLYIAIRSPKAAGGDYAADDRPRPRDADLAAHDRVSLRFDVDRDYTTHFELTVDHRGWTHDACWGDTTWDPTWYVAAADDEATWTVEAAVPLAELVGKPPEAKHVWAVGVRRIIPRVGYESWTGDAADGDSPNQFGLLLFE